MNVAQDQTIQFSRFSSIQQVKRKEKPPRDPFPLVESTQLHQIRQHSVSLVQMGNHPVRGKNYFRSNILDNNLDGKPPCLGKNYSRSNLLDNNSDGNNPTIEKKLIQMGKGTTLFGKKNSPVGEKKTFEINQRKIFRIEHFGEKSRWGARKNNWKVDSQMRQTYLHYVNFLAYLHYLHYQHYQNLY